MNSGVYVDDLNRVLDQIRPCDTDRPYIFVSYSSQDSELVWRDVLTFQRRGYNIWLDEKNLDKKNPSWKNDALEAIRDGECKLVLFYVSASSLCSEACLNEMTETTSEDTMTYHKLKPVNFVAVDAEPVGDITDFYNKVFDKIPRKEKLEFKKQAKVLKIFLTKFFGNNNERVRIHPKDEPGRKGDYYDNICECFPHKSLVYPSVQPEPPAQPEPPEPLAVEQRISLPDFLKKYNINTFKKDTFQQVRLVGSGGYAKYNSPFFDSVYPVVWSFVMKLLEERGEAYLHFVNGKNQGSKNPPFITAAEHQKRKTEKQAVTYRELELPGLEGWSMCRHYGQYDWVSNVLRKRMKELGLPLEAFSFEYVEPGQAPTTGCSAETAAEIKQCPPPQIVTGPAHQENKITGPAPLGGHVSPGGEKRTGLMKFPEMVAEGKVCSGDSVYVKGRPDQRGIITADGKIAYGGQDLSLNQYVKAVLGDGSYNAYIYVYHEKTGKLLNDLR